MAAFESGIERQQPRRMALFGVASEWSGPVLVVLLVAAAGVFFQEGLQALLRAWQVAEYSHGPIIPVLSAMLVLREMKAHPPRLDAVDDRWPGFLVLMLSLLLGLAGKFAGINDIVAYAIIVFIGGLVLTSFGWRAGVRYWPGVLHLVFMLPLPATLYWKVSSTLQLISSEFGVFLITLAEIPVYLDGNIIDLGIYKLHVAEACSGLRYLFPVMSFSYVFAALYRGPIWHKAVLLLAAAPLTVFMNSVRIGVIGIIVNSYGLDHVEGIQHLLEGWVIFLSCIAILFGLARLMLMLQRSPMTLSEALDIDFQGIGPQLARFRLAQPSTPLLAALGVFLAASIAWQAAPQRVPPAIERQSLSLISPLIGDWRLTRSQLLDPRIEATLGADDYFSAVYNAPDEEAYVDLFIAWYEDQTKGGIHSPEVCLPGGGWEMERIERIDMAAQLGVDGAFPMNRAVIQKGEARMLAYYWFEQYGGRQAWDFLAKAALLRDALLHGRSDGALVRMITPIKRGESIADAEDRLNAMLAPIMDDLHRFIPRHDR